MIEIKISDTKFWPEHGESGPLYIAGGNTERYSH